MEKRLIVILLTLTLALCALCAPALADQLRAGAVNDDAAVLSDSTAKDVETLNNRSTVRFTVVTRHFLGGADAQAYADKLFAENGLDYTDALLLLVIGEERYAVSLGSYAREHLTGEQLGSILSSRLRQPFLQERDYDAAVGGFLLAAASQIARSEGVTLNTSGLFGTASSTQTSQSGDTAGQSGGNGFWSGFWGSLYPDSTDGDIDLDIDIEDYEQSGSGFSVSRLLLIAVVLIFISRRRRRQGKRGLGLLGWFTVGAGAREVMRGRRPRR